LRPDTMFVSGAFSIVSLCQFDIKGRFGSICGSSFEPVFWETIRSDPFFSFRASALKNKNETSKGKVPNLNYLWQKHQLEFAR